MGATEREAFFVKCDRETNPQENVDAGIVTALIGMAPVKPAEFIVFKVSQYAAGAAGGEEVTVSETTGGASPAAQTAWVDPFRVDNFMLTISGMAVAHFTECSGPGYRDRGPWSTASRVSRRWSITSRPSPAMERSPCVRG